MEQVSTYLPTSMGTLVTYPSPLQSGGFSNPRLWSIKTIVGVEALDSAKSGRYFGGVGTNVDIKWLWQGF